MYANDPDDFENKEEKILSLLLQANLYKREKVFDKALPSWEKALKLGSYDAGIQLAMYYEHILRHPTSLEIRSGIQRDHSFVSK